MKKIVALIPARSGSVRVKHKNLKQVSGVPLIGLAVRQALLAPSVDEVYISTDSEIYAKTAENYGAIVPFIRPIEISGSESTDFDVFNHFLSWYKTRFTELPELIVQVRPTAPVRESETIQQSITFMLKHREFNSLRSISSPHQSPYKMWYMDENNLLSPVIKLDGLESYDKPTQSLPKAYAQDGIVDIVRPETLLQYRSMAGPKIAGLLDHPKTWDIDTNSDFQTASKMVDCSNQFLLLPVKRAIGGNLGIIQGRLSPSAILQKFPDKTWKKEFDCARVCGYTSIEWIRDSFQNNNNPIWRNEFNWSEISTVSLLSGVSIRSVCDDYVQCCDWEKLSLNQYKLLVDLIVRSSMLGVKLITYPLFGDADITSGKKCEAFRQHIKTLANIAQQFNIRIALEITCDAKKLCEIMEEISIPNVGVCIDTGNLHAAGISAEEILRCEKLFGKIIHIHLKDRDAEGNNVALGKGQVDFAAILDALFKIPFAGLLIAETDRGEDPIETAINNKSFISGIIDNMQL